MTRTRKAVGRLGPNQNEIKMPSSWAENFPALAEWPLHVYAGRLLSGLGHSAAEIPETKVTLPWGEITAPQPDRRTAQRPYLGPNQRLDDFLLRWGNGERK